MDGKMKELSSAIVSINKRVDDLVQKNAETRLEFEVAGIKKAIKNVLKKYAAYLTREQRDKLNESYAILNRCATQHKKVVAMRNTRRILNKLRMFKK